jgi:hypothetical protein
VLLSPPFLLAVNRANNDLVIFVLLALCGIAAAGTTWIRQILAVAVLVLATGLKYYPAAAALVFVWTRPLRRRPAVALGAFGAVVATLACLWSQVRRGHFRIESGLHTLGAPLLWRNFDWSDRASSGAALIILAVAAAVLAKGRFTVGLAEVGEPRERLLAAVGIVALLACFVAGVSFGYRWIFSLWMALWLWRRSSTADGTRRAIATARAGCVLLLLCLWLDGSYCLVVNLFLQPLSREQLTAMNVPWLMWTQPLYWLLMMLFAGWLLEALAVAVRAWHTDFRSTI